jgi:hypothetical protein
LAYESFWWNCVAVKADDPSARCPSTCNGTAAATDGCDDGARDGAGAADALIARFGAAGAKERIRSRVRQADVQQTIRRYFPSGPERE